MHNIYRYIIAHKNYTDIHTLDNYKVDDAERNDEIYIVDPLYSYPTYEKVTYDYKRFLRSIQNGNLFKIGKKKQHIKNFIDSDLLKKALYINQEPLANTYTDAQKFEMAEAIYKIIQTPQPKIHYKVGDFMQKFSIILKRILPDATYEKLLMNHYKL